MHIYPFCFYVCIFILSVFMRAYLSFLFLCAHSYPFCFYVCIFILSVFMCANLSFLVYVCIFVLSVLCAHIYPFCFMCAYFFYKKNNILQSEYKFWNSSISHHDLLQEQEQEKNIFSHYKEFTFFGTKIRDQCFEI